MSGQFFYKRKYGAAATVLFVLEKPATIDHTNGSQSTTLGTEHTLATVNNAGNFLLAVDGANLHNGSELELRVYGKARSSDTERLIDSAGYRDDLGSDLLYLGPYPSPHHLKFTLEQTGGTATAFPWAVYQVDNADFKASATFATGDIQIIKDEGAATDTSNIPTDEGNGFYSIVLTATETNAARIGISVIDQDTPKVWKDSSITIETYGNDLAEHAFDLDTATQNVVVVDIATGAVNTMASGVMRATESELTSHPGATADFGNRVGWIYILSSNPIHETATEQAVLNYGGTATIATATVSDDSTTFIRDKWQ